MITTRPLGQIETDLADWQEQPFRDYRPRFAIERQDEVTIWLTDQGRRIALVDKHDYQIDLFEFQPGRPRLADPRKPPVYHAPTLLGARLTLVQWIGRMGRTSDTWQLDIEEAHDHIGLTITETWRAPQRRSTKRLDLRVDPRLGYILETTDNFWCEDAAVIELYNFLVKGLTHHQPGKRRFPFVLWRTPECGLLKWTSNMVSLRCAGQHDTEHARSLGTQGWVGFFGEPDWNPVFAIAEASQPCSIATCDNLLDEHLCFTAMAPARAGKGHELSCRGMLFALPGRAADTLIVRAAFNDLKADQPNSWWPHPSAPRMRPLCFNQLCDFETPVRLSDYFRGVYWPAFENGDEWAALSDERAHSGRWSLRLRVRPDDGEKFLSPQGSSLWLDAGRTYRLSAWVCHAGGGDGEFRLAASQAYMSFAENREPQQARVEASQARAWQRLELSFTALPNDPCVFIQLFARGDGDWFVDDILFEELS